MHRLKTCCFVVALALCGGITLSTVSVSAGEKTMYSLDDCVQMALAFSPQIKEVQHDVEIAETRLHEVEGAKWVQLETTLLTGPAPDARGDQISSPDSTTKLHGIGPFGRIDMKAIQPLYTFDKITKGIEAAQHGIKVDQARVQQKSLEVSLDIKKYYYGILLATEALRLIDEVDGYIKSALARTNKLLAVGPGEVTELDRDRLEAYDGNVQKQREEASKSIILAKEALRSFMGLEKGAPFEIEDTKLVPVKVEIDNLESYIATSKNLRPEFTQIHEGLAAREALIKVAEADYYPTIFAAAFFSWAEAPDRDRVTNPWINDEFNHAYGGAALGLQWHFDFGITKAKVERSRVEYNKLTKTKDYAEVGIPLQIEKAYQGLVEAKKNISGTEKAYISARRWMVGAAANYEMGVGDSRDLSDALVVYGTTRIDNLTSIFNYNMEFANLLHATGLALKK
jgi:outer membrane protein TolC